MAIHKIVRIFSEFDSLWVSEEVVEDVPSVDEAVPVWEGPPEAHCALAGGQKLNWVVLAALQEEVVVSELNVEARELGIVDPLLDVGEGKLSSESSVSESGSKKWFVW